jgi:polyhydroxyalkanoate synthesis regulator protein
MQVLKYNNRKLYSRDLRRYVNLTEIIDFIKKGEHLQVICHRTKEDLTLDTLKSSLELLDVSQETLIDLIKNTPKTLDG